MEKKSGVYFGKEIVLNNLRDILFHYHTEENADYELTIDCKEFDPRIEIDAEIIGSYVRKEDIEELNLKLKGLPGNFRWCTYKHWHTTAVINEVKYEAYGKETLDGERLLLLEDYTGELNDLRLKICNLPQHLQWVTLRKNIDGTYPNMQENFRSWINEMLKL
ncbi:hypothetical protein HPY28_27595 [Brevibacillus sp. HB1.2]|uniref:hypothetical protein n=1 Tax=Brevibacillus TaxID=55080 RepID=UPI00156B64DF|nr:MULTISPECIES: hypothetical protein [unclassified Brevibacillus]NRS18763.1 hypothetical protein [Brevibacillus sp. HB1.4B]NTU24092.1 hypothetical protein [Brevibacillus sp. HB1.2]NTU33778.1 hypothetical protein [Brevibacillus sp. HB1.1]